MANSFTNILPILTEAAQAVSRESVGMLRAVNLSTSPQGVNLGSTINIPKAPAASAANWTPSLAPTLTDTTASGVQLSLSLAKEVAWHVTAEQSAAMDKGNADAMTWFKNQAAQGMRTLANTVEAYLFDLAYKASSRAVGTAGSTPFTSNMDSIAQVAKILNENGAPMFDRSLVVDPSAYAELQERFASVTSTRDNASFAEGEIPKIGGLQPLLSNQLSAHTAGTGTGYLVNLTAGLVKGTVSVPVDTGSGTILAGDVVLAGTGGRYYVVDSALSGGSFGIGDPGIYGGTLANNTVLTVQSAYTPNLALSRDAVYAAIRAPLQPEGLTVGAQEVVVDSVSGIPFGVYKQVGDGVTHYSVRVIYGGVVVDQSHIATLMG